MSELYTNYTGNKVSLEVPESVPYMDLSFTVNGVPFNFGASTVVRLNQNNENPGVFEYNLPYRAAMVEGTLLTTWRFIESGAETVVRKSYELVTALVPISKLMKRYNLTAEEAEEVEARARQIVKTYTGQTFGKYSGPVTVVGGGGTKLSLPRRLLAVTSVTPSMFGSYNITGSNFFINGSRAFNNDETYVINGVWGYDSVPPEVETAASMIIDTLVADEPSYRDRYLSAIRSADWRLDYNSRAFDGTGNVTVDQLLDPFVVYRIAVI